MKSSHPTLQLDVSMVKSWDRTETPEKTTEEREELYESMFNDSLRRFNKLSTVLS